MPSPPRRRIFGTLQPTDPYASLVGQAPQPYTTRQMRQIISQYTNQLPAGMTYQQIQQRATGLVSPLVAAVTAAINQQAQTEADRIRGLTASTAHEVAQIPFAQPYQQAEQAQANTDAALHQALAGAGSSDASSLASRLAVINDPSVAQAAAAVNANGTGNANASLAQGTNAMSNLIAQAASAGSFGQKLPGIVQLGGIQQLGGLAQDTTNQLASQTQQLEGQVPGLVQNFLTQSDNARTNRAQAAQQLFQYLNDTSGNRSKDLLSLKENQIGRNDAITAGQAKSQIDQQRLGIDQQNANTSTYRAKATAALAQQRNQIAEQNANTSARRAEVASAQADRRIQIEQQRANTATWKATHPNARTPQLTAKQIQDYKGTAATVAENGFKGFTDTKGNVHPPLTYQGAIEEARKEGIPLSIFVPYANMWWKPGYGGRPRGPRPDVNPRTNPNAAGPPAPR